jgi:hypothetical protein
MSRRASSREIAEPGAWVRKKSSSSARGDVCRSELAVLMALFVTMMDPAGLPMTRIIHQQTRQQPGLTGR